MTERNKYNNCITFEWKSASLLLDLVGKKQPKLQVKYKCCYSPVTLCKQIEDLCLPDIIVLI